MTRRMVSAKRSQFGGQTCETKPNSGRMGPLGDGAPGWGRWYKTNPIPGWAELGLSCKTNPICRRPDIPSFHYSRRAKQSQFPGAWSTCCRLVRCARHDTGRGRRGTLFLPRDGAGILLRWAAGCDIRTYGCVGSGPQMQTERSGDLLGVVATGWSARPCDRSVGANDHSPVRRPPCNVSCQEDASRGTGSIHNYSAPTSIPMALHIVSSERR